MAAAGLAVLPFGDTAFGGHDPDFQGAPLTHMPPQAAYAGPPSNHPAGAPPPVVVDEVQMMQAGGDPAQVGNQAARAGAGAAKLGKLAIQAYTGGFLG